MDLDRLSVDHYSCIDSVRKEITMAEMTRPMIPVQEEETVDFQALFFQCLDKWHWFALSVGLTLCLAVFYLLSTPPVYQRKASILIQEDSKGRGSGVNALLSDLGVSNASSNVQNELITLKSVTLMEEVVRRLQLNINYTRKGKIQTWTLYGKTLPLKVEFVDVAESENVSLTVAPAGEKGYRLSDFRRRGVVVSEGTVLHVKQDELVTTPIGSLRLRAMEEKRLTAPMQVTHANLYGTAGGYASRLNAAIANKNTTIVDISFQDVNMQRAEELLDMVITVYNEHWVKDQNQIANNTSQFINERLKVIESELGDVDNSISAYKSEHLVPDVKAASNLYMNQNSRNNSQILSLRNRLSMARYVRNYMKEMGDNSQLLPTNSGIDNNSIENQIEDYNRMQLQRKSLMMNSSEQNPLVRDLDHSMDELREAIIRSIDNLEVTLSTELQSLEREEQQTISQIAANPNQARYLLSVERQQKVKESLYLFLLQKREEIELSKAFAASNSRLITPPLGSNQPVAPVRRNILLMALMAGLMMPVGVLYLLEMINPKVRRRKDLESLSVPLLGVIPLSHKPTRSSRKKQPESLELVVRANRQNVINEAFRLLRTHLELLLEPNMGAHVLMVTAADRGSGKTFLAMNIAMSLALVGKRVLLIDLEMRSAALSHFAGHFGKGVADYLSGHVEDYEPLIIRGGSSKEPDLLPVGTIPSNPTELLCSESFEPMIESLSHHYDYILLDTPSVDGVADVLLINKVVDLTLFVLRAGLFSRRALPRIEQAYNESRFSNLTLVLNGTRKGF